MADPTFKANWSGYRELLTSNALYPALAAEAAKIESRVKSNARDHYRTGEYERSIHTERSRTHDRVRARVISDDDVAPILESRYHIFGRGVG